MEGLSVVSCISLSLFILKVYHTTLFQFSFHFCILLQYSREYSAPNERDAGMWYVTNFSESGAPCVTKASVKNCTFTSQELHYKTSLALMSVGINRLFCPFLITWETEERSGQVFLPRQLLTIIQYKPTKLTFSQLIIFNFCDVFHMFRTRGFIFRKKVLYTGVVMYVRGLEL